MLKVLLWNYRTDAELLKTAIQILARQHGGLELVGVTANNPISIQRGGQTIPFVPFDKVPAKDFDVLLVVGAKQFGMSEVTQLARQLGFHVEKLLGDWIVCTPGFTLDKYRRLQQSRLTIFSKDCFGGIISRALGLPFRSPLVNMGFADGDFIRLLRAPRVYMAEELIFKKLTGTSEEAPDGYPVATLGNIEAHMIHYATFNESADAWNRRKPRINWYNLFVTMITESEEIAQAFDELPYGKKVCFVPFKSDLDSAWYINPEFHKGEPFWRVVHLFLYGEPFYFDMFDMLLYGKKTQLIKM